MRKPNLDQVSREFYFHWQFTLFSVDFIKFCCFLVRVESKAEHNEVMFVLFVNEV